MESNCELRQGLALPLPPCGPSHVLVFIVINKVVLFLDRHPQKNRMWARPHIFHIPLWNFASSKFPTNV
jgi:hypothetical protein